MYWQRKDTPDRQGITEIRYVEGMYEILDELRRRHPGLWVDNCASGGRLIDLEMTMRSIPLHQTDAPYPVDSMIAQLHNHGLNLYVPFHSRGGSLQPTYAFHSVMNAGNVFGFRRESPEEMRKVVNIYQRVRPYFEGDF